MELRKFYNNIKKINDKFYEYQDEDGNISIFPAVALICRCEHLKVDDDRLKIMKFNQEVNKNYKFDKKEEYVPVVDKKIKNHIVDKKVKLNLMWKVTNGCNISEIFNNKEDAINFVNEINNKYIVSVDTI